MRRDLRRLLFRFTISSHRPARLGLTGYRRHSGREEADDLQGSPDESSRPCAEGLHLLHNVVWFAFEGSLLGGHIRPVVAFPVEKITFPFGLFPRPMRRGFDDMRPLVEG